MKDISSIRTEYSKQILDESSVLENPFEQFERWFHEALNAEISESNAMTLSTVDSSGQPCGRIVLLKKFNQEGFTFFTNYKSQKGQHLSNNPRAGLTFFWKELERQVRIEGSTKQIKDEDSDTYFKNRPIGSQIGAIASPQSRVIASRDALSELYSNTENETGSNPTRPSHWGGYLLIPNKIEFWQGRPNRLHDRLVFVRGAKGQWQIERLAP